MMMEWILLQECNMQGFRQIYRTAPQSRIGDGTVHSSSNIIYKHQSSYHVNLSFTYGCCVYTEVFCKIAAIETHCFIAATFLIYLSLTFALALGGFTVFSIL